MKKRLLSCVILSIAAFQLPVFADTTSVSNWTDLKNAIKDNEKETISLTQAINAAAGDSAITSDPTKNMHPHEITIQTNNAAYSITGPGGSNAVFINEGKLTIDGTGGSVIDSNGSSTAAIVNNVGSLILYDVNINGGIVQGANGTTQIGISGNAGTTITLSGATNAVEGGVFSFAGTGNVLNIAGGIFRTANENTNTPGTTFTLNTGNTLNVSGGSVLFADGGSIPGGADTTWSGGLLNLTGGQLTIKPAVSASGIKYAVNPLYTQSGGTLTLNDYTLNLSNPASSITGGNVVIDTGLYINNGQSNNKAVVTMGQWSNFSIGNTSSTPSSFELLSGSNLDGYTLVMGSATNTGNTLIIDSGASVYLAYSIYAGNSLNIAGGTLTLDPTAYNYTIPPPSILWAGNVNMSSGTVNLINGLTQNTANGAYNQTGGTTNINTGSSLTLASGSNITTSGSGVTSTVNIGGGTPTSSLTLNGGSITTSNSGGSTIINIGVDSTATPPNTSPSNGNTLNVSNASSLITNGTSGTTTVNIGVGAATNNSLNLSAGSITGSGTTVNIGTTTAGSTNNSLTVSGTGNIDESATIVLNTNNNLNINGGTVTLNQGGSGIDTLNGTINLSDGTLTEDAVSSTVVVNQTGGSIVIGSDSVLRLLDNTNFSGGNIVLSGNHYLSNTLLKTVGTKFTGSGNIYKDGIGETVFTADNSGFTGTYTQTAGKATIENNFFAGVHNLTGGNIELRGSGKLTLDSADTWTGTNIANKGGAFTLDGFSHNSATAGTYSQTSGTTTLQNNSTFTTNLDTAGNALSDGNVVVNDSTLNLSTTTGATVGSSLSGNSAGVINKNGTGTLLLTGSNSGYYGTLNVNAGEVDFNAASGTRDSYISGTTNLAAGSTLNLNTNGSYVTSDSNNIDGTGTVNKTGTGEYSLNAGSNGTFDYTLNVNQGTMTIATDSSTTANFNAPVSVNSSILRLSSGGTSFNEGLTLDHGYMSILNGGFNATSPGGGLPALTVGSTINTMNGVIASNTITGDLNVGASGIADFLIDVSPSTRTSDNYIISGDITTTNPTGIINISNFNIVGAPTLVQNVTLKVFDQTAGGGSIDAGVSFDAIEGIIKSYHSLYTLSSLGGGNYLLNREGFNPQAFRGQVATEAAYANQLTTNNIIFDHINLVSQQLLAGDKPNVYANENPLYAPYQYSQKDGSLWYKGFGNIERLQLSQGINTQNNMWGSLVGADFPIVELKHGWKVLPTAYVGYTGGYQTYSGVNMYQNGGQAGLMGSFYKGNFVTSLLANAGGYYNDMSVEGNRDQTGNWFAGLAAKSAYNIKLPKDFILQPNMLVGYNAFGKQNWNSDFGGVGMSSGMLNGLNFGPGVNLILNKETWSIYATTQLMVNAMNGVTGTMENIDLPSVKMGSTYIQYGIGATKRIKDRLSMYGQVVFSNGVRTGVGFQGGLQWKL